MVRRDILIYGLHQDKQLKLLPVLQWDHTMSLLRMLTDAQSLHLLRSPNLLRLQLQDHSLQMFHAMAETMVRLRSLLLTEHPDILICGLRQDKRLKRQRG